MTVQSVTHEPVRAKKALEALECGGVVAFATDTLYGIATPLSSIKGYQRIYQIKKG